MDLFLDELNAFPRAATSTDLFIKKRLHATRCENALLRKELKTAAARIAELTCLVEATRASRAWRFAHWLQGFLSSLRYRRGRVEPGKGGSAPSGRGGAA